MQVKDWFVIFIIAVIVVVLLDGLRRKLRDRDRIVVKLERKLPQVDDDELLRSPELPNGGARTKPRHQMQPPPRKPGRAAVARDTAGDLSATAAQDAGAGNRRGVARAETGAVPVLMDTVELEEDRITHASVLADSGSEAFTADSFDMADIDEAARPPRAGTRTAPESDDDLDDEHEEDAGMLDTEPSRQHRGRQDDYRGREDDYDDDDAYEDDDFDIDDEDDDDDEFDYPDDYDDDEEDDDFDDEDEDEDDDYDDDDDYDEDDDEDDELDEFEGLPEDDWDGDEEQDALVDDYENEPVLLQGAYTKATGHFSRTERQPRIEPGFGDEEQFDESEFDETFGAALSDDDLPEQVEAIKPEPRRMESPKARQVDLFPRVAAEASAVVDDEPEPPAAAEPEPPAPEVAAATRDVPLAGPREVIIINVMARQGQLFSGAELLPILQQQGLRLGEMSIFHRHADNAGNGAVMFSMANMVKPGTFDLAAMQDFETPGVSFFVQMPNRAGNMHSFEQMLTAATAVRDTLDGEFKDENRSVFTRQTIEHCRQRILDFELKLQLLAKKH